MVLMFCMTCNFVVITGIQFWITDYFINVMGIDQTAAYKLYFLCGAVGPIGGIILCAFLFDRIGGYTSEMAFPVMGMFGFFAMLFGLFSLTAGESAITCACLISLELFCGAFVMPAATGIMLNQVPPNMRTMANSIANLSYNLFGYLPAPLMYGFFYDMGETKKNNLGLASIQAFTVISFLGFLVVYTRNRYVTNSFSHISDVS